jgi:hypothetical protein
LSIINKIQTALKLILIFKQGVLAPALPGKKSMIYFQ